MKYSDFFRETTGFSPFPYQVAMGEREWPDLLDIPTGLGKTAAVVIAWLWKRLQQEGSGQGTPRRMVYCLPMRVLVEQTRDNVNRWVKAAAPFFEREGREVPRAYILIGGEAEEDWELYPEKEVILIGTQDMLLSRALNRGYGISRYKWPVHFALLHNDALWVYDEVQLMGPGLSTSAQLDAFRRISDMGISSRSLWVSATLSREWLRTVDLKDYESTFSALRLSEEEVSEELVSQRIAAKKELASFEGVPAGEKKKDVQEYLESLSRAIVDGHGELGAGANILAIVNTVERAQELFRKTRKLAGEDVEVVLVHARFRAADRKRINSLITTDPPAAGRIVIATQAVEAGVDISSRILFSELAPWSSMVQRFGRCNRYGEFNESGATVFWIDIPSGLAAPYEESELDDARNKLVAISSASPADLPAVDRQKTVANVLRHKDIIELFNTDSDLSGFDIDVSQFIRDAQSSDVEVFWRDLREGVEEQGAASRDELCHASLKQMQSYEKKRKKSTNLMYSWDVVDKKWQRVNIAGLRPGMTVMLDANEGGYDEQLGFLPQSREPVVLLPDGAGRERPEGNDDDPGSGSTRSIGISVHLVDTENETRKLCEALGEKRADRVTTAARWHDVGKAHEVFQKALHSCDAAEEGILAKSPCRARYERPGFRHELASALSWMENNGSDQESPDADLVAYLIAAHHGKVRMSLRAWPNEKEPDDRTKRFARGIWDGDVLPGIDIDGRQQIGSVVLRLDLMEMGRGKMGRSWRERTEGLLEKFGPFYLAWLETLLRIADWRASRMETAEAVDG